MKAFSISYPQQTKQKQELAFNRFLFLSSPASSEGESEEEGGWREDQEG